MGSTVLVTGGAGYIGSAVVKRLLDQGHHVVIVDNLSKGRMDLVDQRATFYHIDTTDAELIEVFKKHAFDVVMHFAAYKAVGESMTDPLKYTDNIRGLVNVLDGLVQTKTRRIVFSSTAAVYGMPRTTPITEDHPTAPISYYGFTKLVCEQTLAWYKDIHGIEFVALRYFNVAGDAGLGYVDPAPANLFPIIAEVISGVRKELTVFGTDYDTSDGSGVRDYVDINDLVDAHIAAIDKGTGAINIGSGAGYSVKQVIAAFEEEAKVKIPVVFGPRRTGDPAAIAASNAKALYILGWKPKRTLKDMVRTTLEAGSANRSE